MPEQVFSPNIAWYLFLAGAGSGAYTIASFFRFAKHFSSNPNFHEYQSIAQGGFYLGPLIVLIGSLFLVFDLGSPQKAFLLLTTPRLTLLTAGTWFIVLFCITAAATLFMRADSGLAVPRLLDTLCGALSLLFALCIMIYAGILFSSMSALPLLHTPAIVALLMVSALSTGSAVITLYGFLNQQKKSILYSMRIIPKLDISLIALEVLALLAVYLSTTLNTGSAPQITALLSVSRLLAGDLAPLFWIAVVGVGLLVPVLVSITEIRKIRPTMLAASGLCQLAGGLALRYCLILAVQYIDASLFLPS